MSPERAQSALHPANSSAFAATIVAKLPKFRRCCAQVSIGTGIYRLRQGSNRIVVAIATFSSVSRNSGQDAAPPDKLKGLLLDRPPDEGAGDHQERKTYLRGADYAPVSASRLVIRVNPGSDDVQAQFTDPFHAAGHAVPPLDGADAGRRAGEDQISGREREITREFRDHLGDGPDQLFEVAGLAAFAIQV